MFIRSTYFPDRVFDTGLIVCVVIKKIDVADVGPTAYTLYLHTHENSTLQSEPITEDPDTIMQTITDELNGVETKVDTKHGWPTVFSFHQPKGAGRVPPQIGINYRGFRSGTNL